ncbi:MAG: putative gluconate 5-dehydrogenase [Myxococcaceae bacterium]|nr:putative gluconate 5-dehydrogenase [Myxococcaceae bacterium]
MIRFEAQQHFLVTGASSGIGLAVAQTLNALGATVIGVARTPERLEQARQKMPDPARFLAEPRDLSTELDGISSWLQSIAERAGPLHGLVHCAGIYDVTPLKVLSLERVRNVFDVNVFSALALSKGFARRGVNAGESSITLMSSISSLRGFSSVVAYSASKGALNASVRALAHELGRQRIRVNAIIPGVIDTEMTRAAPAEQTAYLLTRQPFGIGQPEDVAHLCAFLASSCGRFITGQCIGVDGGASL